jgi:hypothetical protein
VRALALICSVLLFCGAFAADVTLPPKIETTFRGLWKNSAVVSVKEKKDRIEVRSLDTNEREFKSVFNLKDGSLLEYDEHTIAFNDLPEAVRKAAKEWDAEAKWYPTQKAWKNDGEPAIYELTGTLPAGRFTTKFNSDGVNLKKLKNKDGGSKKSDPSLIRCC